MQAREVHYEEPRADQQNDAAKQAEIDPAPPPGNKRVVIVEVCNPPPLSVETEPMPWQGHHHHPDGPQPQLPTLLGEIVSISDAAGQLWPDLIGDCEIHDHDRAAKDQMKMRGDPRGI